jgi:hypothetical protein
MTFKRNRYIQYNFIYENYTALGSRREISASRDFGGERKIAFEEKMEIVQWDDLDNKCMSVLLYVNYSSKRLTSGK